MKISKKSWHFKVWAYKRNRWEGNAPNNLCGYFWMVLMKLLIGIPFMTVSPAIGISLDEDNKFKMKRPWLFCAFLFLFWYGGMYSYLFLEVLWPSQVFLVSTIFILPIATIVAISVFFESQTKDSKSFTSIAIETIKAQKAKICPKIEVV